MSEPFLAEIRIFGFNFAPRGWAQCDGQILPINQNQSLYSLLGTTYGGDGRTTFALPELRGRVPVHPGENGVTLGLKTGQETVTLDTTQVPNHTHTLRGSSAEGDSPVALGNILADSPVQLYAAPNDLVGLIAGTVADAGGGQGHDNMQPWLALNFCIALQGLFPSRN
jgi:microcystin-dependent protein